MQTKWEYKGRNPRNAAAQGRAEDVTVRKSQGFDRFLAYQVHGYKALRARYPACA